MDTTDIAGGAPSGDNDEKKISVNDSKPKQHSSSDGCMDDYRVTSRQLILKSLQSGDPVDGSLDSESLASRIEQCIFDQFRNINDKYKATVRLRAFSLRDKRDPELRENVLLGIISPERLATMSTPTSRVMVSIQRFMRKIALHQALKTFFITTKKIAERASSMDTDGGKSPSSLDATNILEEEDIVLLCENLVRINEFYQNATDTLAQPPRCLPTSAVFSTPTGFTDPYPAIYSMFNKHHLLPCLYLLLSHWATGADVRIVTAIHRLLSSLLHNPSGLLYLISRKDVIQELLQFLLQRNDDGSEEENGSFMQEFALDMTCHMQCMHYVDDLMHFHSMGASRTQVDDPNVMRTLQSFYFLTLDNQSNNRRGLRAVARILSWKNYLACILPFIELTGDSELDAKIKKSACAGYASELLLLVLRHAESVEYLEHFHERLLAIGSQEVTSKVAEVKHWTEPLKKLPKITFESMEYLMERIKNFVQNEGITPRIPKGLITTLRLARHIAVDPSRGDPGVVAGPVELRYKYALVQFHYFDGLSALLQLIDKLADSHLLNWQQGVSLNSKHGHMFYACVVPAVRLIRDALCYLIRSRGSQFTDQTPIEPLMKLYTVCCTLVPSFGTLPEAQTVQRDIVASLLAFTQVQTSSGEQETKMDDETKFNPSNNLWTKMVLEILKYTSEAPFRFVAGLRILSELLPLPLPIPTKQPLRPEDIHIVLSHRHTWSIHLTPIAQQIQNLIRDLVNSTQHTLQQALRQVCLQLSDLSSSMANVIVRAVADIALENCEKTEVKKKPSAAGGEEEQMVIRRELILPATPGFARILNLLSYMVSQASFKICLLNLLQSGKEKSMDDYGRVLQYLLAVLNHSSTEKSHMICQELIVSTVQSLCDEEVCMVTLDRCQSAQEQLSCCLPGPRQLRETCSALIRHVGDVSQSYATILPTMRILVMLCEHDYGLECIKKALQTEHGALISFFERLLDEFSGHSSDCISTLSTLLQLLRSLQTVEENAGVRTKKITGRLVRKFLDWKQESAKDDHCLVKLEKVLAGVTEDDSLLYSLHEDVSNLVAMLNNTSDSEQTPDIDDEPLRMPSPMDVQQQFNNRQIWVICNDPSEDRLQPNYWFPPDVLDEDDEQDTEMVSYDLETLRAQFLPEFDLAKELMAKISAKGVEEADVVKRKVIPGIINTSRGERKRFVAPLRGRGSVPRGGGVMTRMNDPFRSRVPNTSRPPSMHVDDFILAQHIGQDSKKKKDNTRSGGDRGGPSRSNWRHTNNPNDNRGRQFQSGGASTSRSRGNAFDRPRDRHGGRSGHYESSNKAPRSSSGHKSPSSRHRASSK